MSQKLNFTAFFLTLCNDKDIYLLVYSLQWARSILLQNKGSKWWHLFEICSLFSSLLNTISKSTLGWKYSILNYRIYCINIGLFQFIKKNYLVLYFCVLSPLLFPKSKLSTSIPVYVEISRISHYLGLLYLLPFCLLIVHYLILHIFNIFISLIITSRL